MLSSMLSIDLNIVDEETQVLALGEIVADLVQSRNIVVDVSVGICHHPERLAILRVKRDIHIFHRILQEALFVQESYCYFQSRVSQSTERESIK